MDIQDIVDWASASTKTIELSNGFGDTRYRLRLREFKPLAGDMLYEAWSDGATLKRHYIPPYAIEDMKEVGTELQKYVRNSIVESIVKLVGDSDLLIWETYQMAVRHSVNAPVSSRGDRFLADADMETEARSEIPHGRYLSPLGYIAYDKHAGEYLQ